MIIQSINKSDFKTTLWSGGETTQIYIYPENGDYAKRDFKIRISSASVNDETTEFTPLEGVKRWLMPLSHTMRLKHNNDDEKTVNPFETDIFSGEDKTLCHGKGKDFNLMIKGNEEGLLYAYEMNKNVNKIALEKNKIYVFYAYGYEFKLKGVPVNQDNAVVISSADKGEVIEVKGKGKLIAAEIAHI